MGLKQFLHHITRQKGLNITNPNGQPYNFTGWNDLNTKWIDLEDKYQCYKTNPILNAIINKKASLCSKGRFYVADKQGNEMPNDPILPLLECPNFWQSKEAFIIQWVIINSLDGGAFNYPVAPAGFEKQINRVEALINIPMANADMPVNFGMQYLSDYSGYMDKVNSSKVKIEYQGNALEIPYGALISFYDLSDRPQECDFVNPISRIDSLKMDLSNINVSLEAMNVMANKPGGVGIVGVGSKDSTQTVPLGDTERAEMESKYKNAYGLTQEKSSVIFSTASLTYTSTMVKFADLGLTEINGTSISNTLAVFNMPPEIFSKEQTAYENKKIAELSFIQDEVMRTMDGFCNSLNNFFGYEDKKLRVSFDHLPAFTGKRRETAETLKIVTDTTINALDKGIIDVNKAKETIKQLTGVNYE